MQRLRSAISGVGLPDWDTRPLCCDRVFSALPCEEEVDQAADLKADGCIGLSCSPYR